MYPYKEVKVGMEIKDQVFGEEGVVTRMEGNRIEVYFEDSDNFIVFTSVNTMNNWLIGK